MKTTQSQAVETKDFDELKWLKRGVGAKITHIKSHDPSGPFVQAAIDFADLKQTSEMPGVWPTPTGSNLGFTLRNYLAIAQTLFDDKKVVEAVSFFWGGAPRMRLRFRHEPSSNLSGDFKLDFHIRDFAAAKALADEVVAISKAAKMPKAAKASRTRL